MSPERLRLVRAFLVLRLNLEWATVEALADLEVVEWAAYLSAR